MKRLILLILPVLFFSYTQCAEAPKEASYKNNIKILHLLTLAINNNNNARLLLQNLNNDAYQDLLKSEQANKTNELIQKINIYLKAIEAKEKMDNDIQQQQVIYVPIKPRPNLQVVMDIQNHPNGLNNNDVDMNQENNQNVIENADFECDICMYSGNKYTNHIATDHPNISQRLACNHCGLIKFTTTAMNAHMHRNHPDDVLNYHTFNTR